mgnify:FL=1
MPAGFYILLAEKYFILPYACRPINTAMPSGTTIPNTFITTYSGSRSGRGKSRRYGRKRVKKMSKTARGRVIRGRIKK